MQLQKAGPLGGDKRQPPLSPSIRRGHVLSHADASALKPLRHSSVSATKARADRTRQSRPAIPGAARLARRCRGRRGDQDRAAGDKGGVCGSRSWWFAGQVLAVRQGVGGPMKPPPCSPCPPRRGVRRRRKMAVVF